LGAALGNSKLALWDGGSARYGLGVQSQQFRFHLGGPSDRFSFLGAETGTEVMTLTGTGHLGIGTTTPSASALLHLNAGAARKGIQLTSSSDGYAYSDFIWEPVSTTGFTTGLAQNWYLSHRKDGYFSNSVANTGTTMEFYAIKAGGGGYFAPLSFKSNGDVVLVSNKNATPGNVGIGTTTPLQRLHVEGNIFIPIGNSIGVNQADKFVFDGQDVGHYSLGWYSVPGGLTAHLSGYSGIKLFTQATERLTITQGGNVGIGTAAPTAPLSLGPTLGNSKLALWDGGSARYGLGVQSQQFRFHLGGPLDRFSFLSAEAGAEVMTLTGTGNLGIGTSTPLQRLQVEGNIFIPSGNSIGFNQSDKFVFDGQDVGHYSLGWYSVPGGLTAHLSGYSGIKLFTQATERLTITGGGNVHIGTPIVGHSDTYKLNVFGSARANSIVVNTTGADFVFAKNYRLRSLSEVESFIQANHHLPEIAPAAQMQAEGVSVGELQTQLLQKVEELTLYLIEQSKQLHEQNKKLEAQSKQLENQNKQIEALQKQLAEDKK
jgi:hypothetical protein